MVLCGIGLVGCRHPNIPGKADVPALSLPAQSLFRDINPRWSHDGKSIAFLREAPDRTHQLCLTTPTLQQIERLLPPEIVSPDRDFGSSLVRYTSPNTIAFSPNDRLIVFPRVDWSAGNSGERVPGLGLWSYDRANKETKPLAVHPPRYRGGLIYYRYPQWSPNGKYLSFVGEGIFGQRTLFLRSLLRLNPIDTVALSPFSDDCDWAIWETKRPTLTWRQSLRRSPSVPFTETLRRATPGGSSEAPVGEFWRRTPSDMKVSPVHPHLSHLVWSPDGNWLAFALTPDPLDFDRYAIWILSRDGEVARRISPEGTKGFLAPVWLGKERIGAISPENRGVVSVVSWSLQTGEMRSHGTIESADCDWSPDRTRIVYTTGNSVQAGTTLRILRLKP